MPRRIVHRPPVQYPRRVPSSDTSPQPPPDEARATGLVALLSGALFAWTALPGLHWHDTAEFAAVGWRLSLSHPPGHPLHALLTRAAQTLVPVGDLAFRANLLSGLAVAGALALAYRILRRTAPDLPRWAVASAALLPAVIPAIWLQAARAEVYGLQLLLTVACAGLALRVARGEGRALPALALAFGLAGANHSLIGLFMVPLALWAMAVGLRRAAAPAQALALATPAGALGLAAYLYLPLRATAGGVVGWGRPDTPGAIWSTISARDWTRGLAPADSTPIADNIATLAGFGIGETGPIAAVLLFGALLAGIGPLVRARRAVALAALAAVVIPVASRVIYPLDLANPDLGGYLAGAGVAAIGLIVIALDALPEHPRRWLGIVFPLSILICAPHLDPGNRRGSRSAEQTARARLAEVPPDGAFISSDYATAFQTWGLRALYGARPDVAPIFRGRVESGWQRDRLRATHPAAAEALNRFPAGFAGPADRYEPGVEMHRLGPLAARLRPVGLTLAPDAGWPGIDTLKVAFAPLDRSADHDARRQAAFHYAQLAAHLVRVQGPGPLIDFALDRADALAPGDPMLEALRRAR